MNLENFERLKQALRDNHESFDMSSWGRKSNLSPCGTVGCMAGFCDWLMAIDGKTCTLFDKSGLSVDHSNETYVWNHGTSFLGIGYSDGYKLFFLDRWPIEFYRKYDNAMSSKIRANIAIKRIDHFIKTGE